MFEHNMQAIIRILPGTGSKEAQTRIIFNWRLLITTGVLILCGSYTYATYPAPVNAAALGIMVGVFYYNLHRHDPVSFLIQLLIGNFFIFGNKYGGNYNIAAFSSIIIYTAINGRMPFLRTSVLSNSIKTALFVWAIFDLLSLTGGNFFPLFLELQNFLSFCMMLYLIYFASRIQLTEADYYKIIVTLCIFFVYEFIIAMNQKYEWYNSPYPFFPSTNPDIDFTMDIVRSSSTLNNFEAFAEFCVSLMSLLISGILSGSSLLKNKFFYYFSIFTILISILSIVYSGTRSSILLLPLAVVGPCIMLGKRLKAKMIIYLIVAVTGLLLLNVSLKFVDFSVFEERSENMDDVTLTSVLNGDALNRGGLFPYAFKQVEKTNLFYGRGYFMNFDEYHYIHFQNESNSYSTIADYHNLYMSAYVLWGPGGFFCMMFVFLYSLYNGWKTYWKARKKALFTTDLLLGFNFLFVILLINQFKIQFIRDINYFTLVMLLLVLYISLTQLIKQTALEHTKANGNQLFSFRHQL